MNSLIKLDNVCFTYKQGKQQTQILKEHRSQIGEKEFVSLVGLSGCGKSTVLKLIAGLYEPERGSIEFGGRREGKRLGQVGFMPQQDMLMPWRNVLDNAALPLEIQGMEREQAYEKVLGLLPLFGLEGYQEAMPHQLSGGMRQRVSFLRAVLGGHSLLLLDEPFSALDAFTRKEMQQWLTEAWQSWGSSIFLVTHDLEEAIFLSDRIFIMEKGQTGPFQEIVVPFARPRSFSLNMNEEFIELRRDITQRLYEKREGL